MNYNNKTIVSLLYFMLILSFVSIITNSCDSNKYQLKIHGNISNIKDQTIVLEQNSGNGKRDTIAAVSINKEGRFKIEIDSVKKGFYRFKIDDDNIIFLYLDNGDNIYIETKFPKISKHYTITGSNDNKLLRNLNLRLIESAEKIEKIEDEYKNKLANSDESTDLDSLYHDISNKTKELFNSDRDYILNFIKVNHKSPSIYIALYQYFGMSPLFDINNDLDIFESVLYELKKHNPDLSQISLLESDIYKANMIERQISLISNKLKLGSYAPEFTLLSTKGKEISLKDFKKQDIILVFWASWSQRSINLILQIAENIDPKQNLILISLDNTPESLNKAILENGFEKFLNLCDYNSWESPICKLYNISKIPIFYVINKDGAIVSISSSSRDIH